MENLKEEIKKIMEEIFGVSLKNLKDEDISEAKIENWDSLSHVNLMMALEQKFNVKLSLEEIEKLRDLESIYQTIKSKISKG